MSDNGKNSIKSLNPTLNYILSDKLRESTRAIVDAGGDGHYETIKGAVDAGETYIFVKNGEYTETSDITLSGASIIGESAQGVKITLQATIYFDDNENDTDAGTVHFTQNDKTVTGAGSNFTSIPGSDPNKQIAADGITQEVSTITDATNLELYSTGYSPTTDPNGANYALDYIFFSNKTINSSVQNVTIIHDVGAATNAIVLQGTRNFVYNVAFKDNDKYSTFIRMPKDNTQIATSPHVQKCHFEGGRIGIYGGQCYKANIAFCTFCAQSDYSIGLNEDVKHTNIISCFFYSTYLGISATNAKWTVINNCQFLYTSDYAIKLSGPLSDYIHVLIANSVFKDCHPGNDSIFLDRVDHVTINNCTFSGANTFIDSDSSQYINITNNTFYDCANVAIYVDTFSGGLYWKITGNTFYTDAGGVFTPKSINITCSNSIISGNVFKNCGEESVTLRSAKCIVSHNQFEDCDNYVVYSISDNTVISNNFFKDCINSIYSTGNRAIINGNMILDDGDQGITIQGDWTVVSGNNVNNSTNDNIEITATADRTCATSNISLNAGGNNLLDNGTNTTTSANITV